MRIKRDEPVDVTVHYEYECSVCHACVTETENYCAVCGTQLDETLIAVAVATVKENSDESHKRGD